jgi:fumarate reductase flavoprotein subunit
MKYAGNKPNQRLLRLWADYSGSILDWVMDMTDPEGIQTLIYQWPRPARFDLKTEYYPEFPVTHWQTNGLSTVLDHSLSLNNLQKHALKNGVDIRYETRAMQLVRESNGRVTGVIARDKNGRFLQFIAVKAVILCTGDYGNNPWMMQKYCPLASEVALENNIYMTRNEDLRVAPSLRYRRRASNGHAHWRSDGTGSARSHGPCHCWTSGQRRFFAREPRRRKI